MICINPIVPILNMGPKAPLRGNLSNKGVSFVLDHVLRIMLHGRMVYGLERYEAEHPEVDILLIEPTRDDMRLFGYNIMRMSAGKVVAEDGYRSVVQGFRRNLRNYERVLKRHGVRVSDPARLPEHPARHPHRSPLARSLGSSLDLLQAKLG